MQLNTLKKVLSSISFEKIKLAMWKVKMQEMDIFVMGKVRLLKNGSERRANC
tara:strand:- start:301 stop:456 length:156 start_codon:yes stop_codon:yes gene_type:complete